MEEELRRRGARIIDAACSRVKASQRMARTLAERGQALFIAGEKDHAEVRGIAAHAGAGIQGTAAGGDTAAGVPAAPVFIVGNAAEAEAAALSLLRGGPPAPGFPGGVPSGGFSAALIAQTTFGEEAYEAIARTLRRHFPRLEVKQTICGATAARQEALGELCAGAEILVIAGGKDSANTRRLLSIAESRGLPAILAESAGDLETPAARRLLSGRRIAGLSAGASTPDSVIGEIEQKLAGM
jgi:4-hydroxy-3-methylbut-2-enyl diphosphate reductase